MNHSSKRVYTRHGGQHTHGGPKHEHTQNKRRKPSPPQVNEPSSQTMAASSPSIDRKMNGVRALNTGTSGPVSSSSTMDEAIPPDESFNETMMRDACDHMAASKEYDEGSLVNIDSEPISPSEISLPPSLPPALPLVKTPQQFLPLPKRTIYTDKRISKTSSVAELWYQNQSTSPLLRLPAHIRSRIYNLVLGNKTIMIDYETYDPIKYKPVFRYISMVVENKTHITDRNYFVVLNAINNAALRVPFTPLNSVCRQLYMDTALLPYQLSLFVFISRHVAWQFLTNHLPLYQRDAVRKMVVIGDLPGENLLSAMKGLAECKSSNDVRKSFNYWGRGG